jgi:hypothetical protein
MVRAVSVVFAARNSANTPALKLAVSSLRPSGSPAAIRSGIGSGHDGRGAAVARALSGRWTRAFAAAGVGPAREPTVWTDKRIAAALKDRAEANGAAPTRKKWDAAGSVPPSSTIRRHFGSWADALDAGLDGRSP